MYTYTLDGNTVNPLGEWTIEYQRNKGQIFFRRILRGELFFKGADYTLIMGTMLVYAILLVLMNILVDISYAFLDPRIRFD